MPRFLTLTDRSATSTSLLTGDCKIFATKWRSKNNQFLVTCISGELETIATSPTWRVRIYVLIEHDLFLLIWLTVFFLVYTKFLSLDL